jgi:hypothetical protein
MVAGLSFTTTERGKLQRLMNAATKAHNAAHKADRALNAYCDAVWGFAPGDRDLDQIIDHCFGGCGVSPPWM